MRGVRKSISVSDVEGASFVPEGYVVDVRVTNHLTGEDGHTVGILSTESIHFTYGEAMELYAQLGAFVGSKL